MFKVCSSLVLVIACVACGSSFTAHEGGGAAGFGNAGDANGGQPSSAGDSSIGDAGDTSNGGSSSGGTNSSGGDTGSAGASAGQGGASSGGSAGTPSEDPCVKFKQQYDAALAEARVCELNSTGECSPSSTVEPLNCGCPVLVNSKTDAADVARKARQEYQSAKCGAGTVCPAVACAQPTTATCAPAKVGGNTFVCTAGNAVAN